MKRNLVFLAYLACIAMLCTACGNFEGRECEATVLEFSTTEKSSETFGYKILIHLDSEYGEITVDLKNVEYENCNIDAQRITRISAGSSSVTEFNVKNLTLVFADEQEVLIAAGEVVTVHEIRKNVWTIILNTKDD